MSELEARRLKLQAMKEAREARLAAGPAAVLAGAPITPSVSIPVAASATPMSVERASVPAASTGGGAGLSLCRNVVSISIEPNPALTAQALSDDIGASQRVAKDTYDKSTLTTEPWPSAPTQISSSSSEPAPHATVATNAAAVSNASFAGGSIVPDGNASFLRADSVVAFLSTRIGGGGGGGLFDRSNDPKLLELPIFRDVITEAAFVLCPPPNQRQQQQQVSSSNDVAADGVVSFTKRGDGTASSAAPAHRSLDHALGLDDEAADGSAGSTAGGGGVLSQIDAGGFVDNSAHGLAVQSVSWQPTANAEFFVAAYGTGSSGYDASSGVSSSAAASGPTRSHVAVWSTHRKRAPAFLLHSDQAVADVKFHPQHPSLIIGATASHGGLVVWDIRSGSRPVRQSFPSNDAHTSPVVAIGVMGVRETTSLVTFGTDGRVCQWGSTSGALPSAVVDFTVNTSRRSTIAATTASLCANDPSQIVLGCSDGSVCFGTMAPGASRLAPLTVCPVAQHAAPVTAVRSNALYTGGLFASSSSDGTVRLWSNATGNNNVVVLDYFADAVSDIAWSPTNPSLIACGDVSGCVNLHSALDSADQPKASLRLSHHGHGSSGAASGGGRGSGGGTAGESVNRIAWHPSGALLAVGTSHGHTALVQLRSDSGLIQPSGTETLNHRLPPALLSS